MIRKKKNKFVWILLISVILIWGLVISHVISFFTGTGEDNSNEISVVQNEVDKIFSNKKVDSKNENITYLKLNRDPFSFTRKLNNNFSPTKKVKRPPILIKQLRNNIHQNRTEFRINGIIINPEGKLVIFEDLTNNKILFLKEGEVYNDITIKEIDKQKVILLQESEQKEISL